MMPLIRKQKTTNNNETVVLLHGIAQTRFSMFLLERKLKKEGYQTLNISYPSTDKTIEELAFYLSENHLTDEFWTESNRVHIVTHSMGGLVARHYLDIFKNTIPKAKVGRVVMLSPPLGGSEVSDVMSDHPFYQWIFGPAGGELTTQHQSHIQTDIYYDLGIIAGTKKWPFLIASNVIPGQSDGRVSVEKTKIRGMVDHISVNSSHTFIMCKPSVHKLIVSFLKHGRFKA